MTAKTSHSGRTIAATAMAMLANGGHGVYGDDCDRRRACGKGGNGGGDSLVHEEEDEEWAVELAATKGRGLVTIVSASRLETEVRLLDPRRPAAPPRLVAPRRAGVSYVAEQLSADWLLLVVPFALTLALRTPARGHTPSGLW